MKIAKSKNRNEKEKKSQMRQKSDQTNHFSHIMPRQFRTSPETFIETIVTIYSDIKKINKTNNNSCDVSSGQDSPASRPSSISIL